MRFVTSTLGLLLTACAVTAPTPAPSECEMVFGGEGMTYLGCSLSL
jgi:hypothetical protein